MLLTFYKQFYPDSTIMNFYTKIDNDVAIGHMASKYIDLPVFLLNFWAQIATCRKKYRKTAHKN